MLKPISERNTEYLDQSSQGRDNMSQSTNPFNFEATAKVAKQTNLIDDYLWD